MDRIKANQQKLQPALSNPKTHSQGMIFSLIFGCYKILDFAEFRMIFKFRYSVERFLFDFYSFRLLFVFRCDITLHLVLFSDFFNFKLHIMCRTITITITAQSKYPI